MIEMFYGCISLTTLPDISKWDISNAKTMSNMFCKCHSLISIPDITAWKSNFLDMSYFFSGCNSLTISPNLSKWFIFNINSNDNMFTDCYSLLFLFKSKEIEDIQLSYNINIKGKNRILGEKFVKENYDKYILIYKNKKYILKEYFEDIDNNKYNKEKYITLILRRINNNPDLSFMFSECAGLISANEFSRINIKDNSFLSDKNKNSSEILELYNKIPNFIELYLPLDIKGIDHLFYNCKSLKSLPDISKWNTNNVTQMNNLFYNCESLISLPDISKWNTNNVTHMNYLFYNCDLLISLPDISKWNTNNLTQMNNLFYNCKSLILLPDISKWNTNNVTHMNNLFYNCKSLISLPDISIWNTNNVIYTASMFNDCISLLFLPDLQN